ncbi:MAG: sensor histidine kinase, partial [Waterburya sp.]
MSNNNISSTEFATLCQSQIALLSQSLGAMWSVIYLTDEMGEDGQSQLFPFAIYPQAQAQRFFELPPI